MCVKLHQPFATGMCSHSHALPVRPSCLAAQSSQWPYPQEILFHTSFMMEEMKIWLFFFLSEPQYPRAGSWHILYNLQFCGPLLHLVVCLLHKHMNQAFLGTCESWYMYAAVYFPWLYLHKIGVLVLMIWCKEYSENKCYFISNCSIAGVLTNRLLPTVAKYWEKIL